MNLTTKAQDLFAEGYSYEDVRENVMNGLIYELDEQTAEVIAERITNDASRS